MATRCRWGQNPKSAPLLFLIQSPSTQAEPASSGLHRPVSMGPQAYPPQHKAWGQTWVLVLSWERPPAFHPSLPFPRSGHQPKPSILGCCVWPVALTEGGS